MYLQYRIPGTSSNATFDYNASTGKIKQLTGYNINDEPIYADVSDQSIISGIQGNYPGLFSAPTTQPPTTQPPTTQPPTTTSLPYAGATTSALPAATTTIPATSTGTTPTISTGSQPTPTVIGTPPVDIQPNGGTDPYGTYIQTGMLAAQKVLTDPSTQKFGFTPYTSTAANAPVKTEMYDYQANSPLQKISAPNYSMSATAPSFKGGSYEVGQQSAPWQGYTAQGYTGAAPTQERVGTNSDWNSFNFQNPATNAPGFNSANTNTNWNTFDFKDPSGNAPTFNSANTTAQFDRVNTQTPFSNFDFKSLGKEAPTYQGLMGGDYDKLQSALSTPGSQKIDNAYNSGMQNLNQAMSGKGLYGSSVMQQQQTQGLDRERMNAVSANEAQAAATRYGMQQQDLNRAADISMAEWQGLMSENLAGNQIGAQQNLARNAQNLAGTQLGLQQSLAGNAANQQNVDRALQQSLAGNQFNQSNYQTAVNAGLTGQQLGAAQNLAMNAQNLTGTQLGLQQSLAGNQFNQANWQTGVNAGLTGQQLGAAQNLAMNAANQQNMDRGLLQATNANNLSQAQWMARINEQQGLAQIGANQNLAQNAQGVSMAQLAQQGLLANAQNRLTADTTQNEFGLNLFDKGLQRENNINQFNLANTAGLRTEADTAARYGALNTDAQNQYNTLRYNNDKTYNDQLTNWANQQNYERNFLYPQQQAAYSQSQDEMLMNRALALAGQGAPLANSANNYALQQQQMAAQQAAANQQSQSQLWGAGMGLLGNLGNSYLNNYTGNGLLGLSQP